jgi:hypothetical protein
MYAQKRHWKAFQVGGGVQRTQMLNDGFHSLMEDGKVASTVGFNISVNYIINPIIIRTSLFRETFTTDDPTYIYDGNVTKLQGYKAALGFNILPHTKQVLDFFGGYNYASLGSVDESSVALTSRILQFPFWGVGYTTNPLNKMSASLNYTHPLKLTQDNYSQLMLSLILNF